MSYFTSQQAQRPPTSYFSSGSSSPTMQFRRSPSVQQQMRGQSYSVAKKQKESEVQAQSTERMSSLHSRLQQEAEKIRKWKNAIELDSKHKEKCLEEANCTIANQQKVITELQLKNEALQVQVEEEIANQKEIKTKISTTREMCTALKNHCIKIDAALAKGQEDKEKLFRVDQERVVEYQMLLDKYEELEKEQVQWQQTHQDALSTERREKEGLAERCAELSEKMEESLSQIKILEEQLAEEKASMVTLEEALVMSEKEANRLKQDQECLQASLRTKGEQISDLNDRAAIRDEEIKSSRRETERIIKELAEVKTNFIKQLESRQEEVNRLEESLDRTKSEWTSKYENLNSELAGTLKSLEETAISKEMVVTQLTESKITCKSMKEELELAQEACITLEAAKKLALTELDEIKRQLVVSRKEADCQREDKEKGLERAEKLVSEVVCRHDNARVSWQEKKTQLESQLAAVEGQKDRLNGELLALKQELQVTDKKLEESITLAKDTELQHETRARLLTSEMEGLKNECDVFKQQIEDLTKNEKTLALQCSDKADVVRQNGELAAQLEFKQEQLRSLENKLTQEREAALVDCEALKREVQAFSSQLTASKCNQETEKQKYASELQIARDNFSQKIAALSEEMEKLKKEADSAKKEHIRGKKECDKEVQDLVAAMDSYRSEHEKTIAGKERVIESLRLQLQQNEQYQESSERELKIYEGQLKQLRSVVEEKNYEIKQLVSSVDELKMKVEASEKEIDKKNIKVKELRNSIEVSSQKAEESISSDVVSTTPSKKVVKSTPRVLALKQKPSTTVPEIQSTVEPSSSQRGLGLKSSVASSNTPTQHPAHIFKTPALPTPGRLYSYSVKATPHQKTKSLHITPRTMYGNRGKRMRCHMSTDSIGNEEKENTTVRVAEDEEIVLKKQRTKNARATVHQVSSTTTTKSAKRGPAKKKQSKEDLSWFELDSVYGFGSNDC